jgi:dissimilatory sulfite reductase (desulfoviridin) alpha/beta subunit
MNEADYKELKKGGMMCQAEAGLFSVRLHVVGGRLTTAQLRAIREAADRFGRGEIHLTSRQGVEIPSVPQGALTAVKKFLAPSGVGVGVAGPMVRTVTACQGCRVCPSGVIDSPELAEAADRELYGKPAPHKFKVGISGCVNNCMKAEENDIGIKGWIEPRWEAPACAFCGVCQAVCPAKAISTTGDGGTLIVDPTLCIGCGDCIASCPTGSMREKIRGYRVFAGGKFGRRPSLGRRIPGVLRTKEEAMAAILVVLDFFREHGKPRERFGDALQRTGFLALETFVNERTGCHDAAAARRHRVRLPDDVHEGQGGVAAGPLARDTHRSPERRGAEERDLLFENRWAPRDERGEGGRGLPLDKGSLNGPD